MGLEKIAEDVLIRFLSTAGEVKDFALEQAPLVVQEFITYNIAVGSLFLVLAVVLTAIGFILFSRVFRGKLDKYLPNKCTADGVPLFLVKMILLIASLSLILGGFQGIKHNSVLVLKATVAPRVFILEKVSDLVKDPAGNSQDSKR